MSWLVACGHVGELQVRERPSTLFLAALILRIATRSSQTAAIEPPTILKMAVWQWFKAIPPRTRVMIGVGIMAYAGAGLYLSDKAEERFGLTPTEKDREELRNAMPTIAAVERGKK
ncbi:uncharacterized protein K460DRAFT_407688 [Cucurbitaria berberidis CBS 394.84]|uniref:Uncharacterized protein n=1 Tax=Cucurbitaria berberidis CBS 394.84 TaxID=1168544 RepID=A0A9P4GCF9_9PLEO|nr:uncharacterized protein K460DRAFT_407688 [Cucurbitaria berberidis CBS 394.84]KAF1843328.1 hypothetical protein K460DRAFT_407688 [Cucurbitaria berberidis CBS 394.84]